MQQYANLVAVGPVSTYVAFVPSSAPGVWLWTESHSGGPTICWPSCWCSLPTWTFRTRLYALLFDRSALVPRCFLSMTWINRERTFFSNMRRIFKYWITESESRNDFDSLRVTDRSQWDKFNSNNLKFLYLGPKNIVAEAYNGRKCGLAATFLKIPNVLKISGFHNVM